MRQALGLPHPSAFSFIVFRRSPDEAQPIFKGMTVVRIRESVWELTQLV
jgi:hypothetical protein